MKETFDSSSYKISKLVTNTYSTSFSLGINLLGKKVRPQIYAIYGFVRYADEIVDTFHEYDQKVLIEEFVEDYHKALERKISLNPILNSFQEVVNQYGLHDLVDSFIYSMMLDLEKEEYKTEEEYKKYIYGSADVVGLMCLKIFVDGDNSRYEAMKDEAMKLGSAFQKVNFLRDLKDDFERLGRSYFPNVTEYDFTENTKLEIIADIEDDFKEALQGILKLPIEGRLGVYVAYKYYLGLLKKIKQKSSETILQERIRISNPKKIFILAKSYVRHRINML
ncbi:MAG: squalene/phytoene synthase family protein [Flavobacteriales bacterium]|jgi:phytoene synthase|tara:strand:+ start:952 stop:1788 length:837 start_codon:yes stop_codon:yes gene_type:complete